MHMLLHITSGKYKSHSKMESNSSQYMFPFTSSVEFFLFAFIFHNWSLKRILRDLELREVVFNTPTFHTN